MEKFNLKDFKCSSQAQLPEMLSTTHDVYTISKTHSSGPKKNPLNKVSESVSQLFLQLHLK